MAVRTRNAPLPYVSHRGPQFRLPERRCTTVRTPEQGRHGLVSASKDVL